MSKFMKLYESTKKQLKESADAEWMQDMSDVELSDMIVTLATSISFPPSRSNDIEDLQALEIRFRNEVMHYMSKEELLSKAENMDQVKAFADDVLGVSVEDVIFGMYDDFSDKPSDDEVLPNV